jgi:hypothetical protein
MKKPEKPHNEGDRYKVRTPFRGGLIDIRFVGYVPTIRDRIRVWVRKNLITPVIGQ